MAAERSVPRPLFLVTGGTGQIGYELIRELASLGNVLAPTRNELDLARPESIREVVRRTRPDVIVNAAAYTAVDRAESDRDACFAANAIGPGVLAEEAMRVGAALVHYSTDYVFDGTKREPYEETDEPRPINVYGESKLAGERAIAGVGGAWIVIRTSWVYGLRGHNFLLTVLRLARERDELRIVDDQIGAPTWSRSIAQATAKLLSQREEQSAAERVSALSGVYHLTSAGTTTWCGFARAILDLYTNRSEQRGSRVVGIPSEQYPTAAPRPKWSALNCEKIAGIAGLRIGDWQAELHRVMNVTA